MDFEGTFRAFLKILGTKKQKDITEKTGISQSTLSSIMTKPKRQAQLSSVSKIIDGFDDDTFIEFVKQIRPHILWAVADAKYREVPTYDITGAKHVQDLTATKLLFTLRIPEKFFPSDFAVLFSGKSMDKIIPDKAAAGVDKSFDLRTGEIYLCELPVEGLTFKRVIYHPDRNGLEFRAETKSETENIPSHFYHVDEGETYIVGKLTWIAKRI